MMDENTALNDITTTTTQYHDEKEKTGYTPLMESLALLLGVAFYARRIGKIGIQNMEVFASL